MTGKSERAMVWQEHLERQAQSGMSIAEYCDANDIGTSNFYQWRKRLQNSSDGAAGRPDFVRLEMLALKTITSWVSIELPGGAVVRLDENTPAETLVVAIQAAARCDAIAGGERC